MWHFCFLQCSMSDMRMWWRNRNSPFPFEGGFRHVRHGDHLFPGSDPHDGAVVAVGRALQPQTGEGSPRQSSLHKHRAGNFSLRNSRTHTHTQRKVEQMLTRRWCGHFAAMGEHWPPGKETPPACWGTLGSSRRPLRPRLRPDWPAAWRRHDTFPGNTSSSPGGGDTNQPPAHITAHFHS